MARQIRLWAAHNFPEIMPTTVTVTAFPGDRDIPVAQIRIFTVTLGSNPLPRDFFEPNAHLKTRILKARIND